MAALVLTGSGPGGAFSAPEPLGQRSVKESRLGLAGAGLAAIIAARLEDAANPGAALPSPLAGRSLATAPLLVALGAGFLAGRLDLVGPNLEKGGADGGAAEETKHGPAGRRLMPDVRPGEAKISRVHGRLPFARWPRRRVIPGVVATP